MVGVRDLKMSYGWKKNLKEVHSKIKADNVTKLSI